MNFLTSFCIENIIKYNTESILKEVESLHEYVKEGYNELLQLNFDHQSSSRIIKILPNNSEDLF